MKIIKKKYLILFIMQFFIFLGCKDKIKDIKDKAPKRYKVAISFEYYPLIYRDEITGKRKGIIYEISKEIERRGNYAVVVDEKPSSKIIDAVAKGIYDVGIVPFGISDQRNESVDFTESFYSSEIIVLGNKNIDYKENKKDIYGVQVDSIFEEAVNKINKDFILVRDRHSRLVSALVNKEVDYVVTYLEIGMKLIEDNPELFIKKSLEKIEIAFILPKTVDKSNLNKVNSIILEMKSDETIEKLRKKYKF